MKPVACGARQLPFFGALRRWRQAGVLGPVCKDLSHLCGDVSYTKETQALLFQEPSHPPSPAPNTPNTHAHAQTCVLFFQIDYYRDPMRVSSDAYKNNSELAQWNNEVPRPSPGADVGGGGPNPSEDVASPGADVAERRWCRCASDRPWRTVVGVLTWVV
jgi:hypothetical protein